MSSSVRPWGEALPLYPFTPISSVTTSDLASFTPLRAATASAPEPVEPSVADPIVASMAEDYLFDYYYRIWVFPSTLTAQNPQYDVPIPFFVWNAFPQPIANTLQDVTTVDADGLELEGNTPTTLRALEYRQMGVVITPAAPGSIDAQFTFDFLYGTGSFRFVASIANVLSVDFETSIVVTYNWLTDVLESYNGAEQRIALRKQPRRTFDTTITLLTDADRVTLYNMLYKSATSMIVMPCYHTQTPLRAPVNITDTAIYCDTKQADLRVGGYVLLMRRDGTSMLSRVESVDSDHVIVDNPIVEAFRLIDGVRVMNAVQTRLPDGTGLRMSSVSGTAEIRLNEYVAPSQLPHPLTNVTLTQFAGAPILERRPTSDEAPELFRTGLEVIDNMTGRPQQFTAWNAKLMEGERAYLAQTLFSRTDIDYWLTFLEYCRGRQKHFYTSTFRHDLVFASGGAFDNTKIEVEGLTYAQTYFGEAAYNQIELVTSIGTYYLGVAEATASVASSLLTFAEPIPDDLTDVAIERISYLMKVRLGGDTVTFNYQGTYAMINLSLKMVV